MDCAASAHEAVKSSGAQEAKEAAALAERLIGFIETIQLRTEDDSAA